MSQDSDGSRVWPQDEAVPVRSLAESVQCAAALEAPPGVSCRALSAPVVTLQAARVCSHACLHCSFAPVGADGS
jgi:hypothetical protein